MDENPHNLCQHAGKVVLVVNTATACGYTPQLEGLARLQRKYQGQGLVVLGFPSNDFGGQEPRAGKEIADYCQVNYGVDFPMFSKSRVAAAGGNPLFDALAKRSGQRPRWNFHKYLIGRDGQEVVSFPSEVAPESRLLVSTVERMLARAP